MLDSPKKLKSFFSEEEQITITRKSSDPSMVDINNSIFSFPSSLTTRRFITCAYVFFFAFIICSSFFIFYTPSQNLKTVWLENIFHNRTQFSAVFSRFYYNGSYDQPQKSRKTNPGENKLSGSNSDGNLPVGLDSNGNFSTNSSGNWANGSNSNAESPSESKSVEIRDDKWVENMVNVSNSNAEPPSESKSVEIRDDKWPENMANGSTSNAEPPSESKSVEIRDDKWPENMANRSNSNAEPPSWSKSVEIRDDKWPANMANGSNSTADPPNGSKSVEIRDDKWLENMIKCSVFHGKWVPDNEGPIYKSGSCPLIDQDFDCFLNGRTEFAYEKHRWKPQDCDIPRWNGEEMLKLLEGKRLVYVGDSLNRNMWESMVCMLRDSVQNKSNVFEALGNKDFKVNGWYSFLFTDHNFSVEFFRSNFLVQESSVPNADGSSKETLRIDLVEHQSEKYKDADILIFNTGHWWTHEKTQEGKGYYQEGNHVYEELNVFDALRKAMITWSNWIDENVDTKKTLVFFRGYSASHFSGGKWNTGGACDNETLPIYDEEFLNMQDFIPWVESLESGIHDVKTPVFYLNVTRMSDFRKDAHPSIYRKANLTERERRMKSQDCSHWCLPGVPDTWNEIVYSRILMRHMQRQQEEKRAKVKPFKLRKTP